MSDEKWPEFGNAPECPKGFIPDYKLKTVNEEKREFRRMWKESEEKIKRLEASMFNEKAEALESLKDVADINYGTTGVAVDIHIILKIAKNYRKAAAAMGYQS